MNNLLLDLFIMFLKKLKILSAKAGLRQNFKEIGRIYPKAALFYKLFCLLYFLPQPSNIFTQISAISVTFRNSAESHIIG